MLAMGLATTLVSKSKKRLSTNHAAISGLLSGMACSMAVYEAHAYPYQHPSCREAMRGDWLKIGDDFNVVMNRAREEAEK